MYPYPPKRKADFSGVSEALVKFIVFIAAIAIVIIASGGLEMFK